MTVNQRVLGSSPRGGATEKHLLVMAGAFFCSVRFSTREARKLACVLPPPFHHLSLKDNPARKIGPLLNCSPKE